MPKQSYSWSMYDWFIKYYITALFSTCSTAQLSAKYTALLYTYLTVLLSLYYIAQVSTKCTAFCLHTLLHCIHVYMHICLHIVLHICLNTVVDSTPTYFTMLHLFLECAAT